MKKSKNLTCLLMIIFSAFLTSCKSSADRKIEERNAACTLQPAPGDPVGTRKIDGETWTRASYTAEWVAYARSEAECVRKSECAMLWLQYDGNCGWQAADRYAANPLRAMIGITFSCDIPKPVCSKP